MEIDQNFVTIKVWRQTRRIAKYLALERSMSLAELLNDLVVSATNGNSEFDKEDDEYIYFIQSLDGGNIKIGKSIKPIVRLKQLQDMHKDKTLKIIGLIKGSFDVECELHTKFACYQKGREWFEPHQDIFQYIKENTLDIQKTLENSKRR